MRIDILAVGKIKEAYFKGAVAEYAKRLERYCALRIIEVPDFPDDKNALEREGALLLPRISGLCIPLCVEGRACSSEEFAGLLQDSALDGQGHFTFVIGGSGGLHEDVKRLGKHKLSFSKMTFPHRLMRVILLEQIYRAFKIMHNEAYHK